MSLRLVLSFALLLAPAIAAAAPIPVKNAAGATVATVSITYTKSLKAVTITVQLAGTKSSARAAIVTACGTGARKLVSFPAFQNGRSVRRLSSAAYYKLPGPNYLSLSEGRTVTCTALPVLLQQTEENPSTTLQGQ